MPNWRTLAHTCRATRPSDPDRGIEPESVISRLIVTTPAIRFNRPKDRVGKGAPPATLAVDYQHYNFSDLTFDLGLTILKKRRRSRWAWNKICNSTDSPILYRSAPHQRARQLKGVINNAKLWSTYVRSLRTSHHGKSGQRTGSARKARLYARGDHFGAGLFPVLRAWRRQPGLSLSGYRSSQCLSLGGPDALSKNRRHG